MQLKDKVAYITGSASGIGKEIAILFAQEGAKIVIADLNKDAADATAAELKATGAQAIGVAVDVTNEAQVDASVEEAAKAFGGIDILVNNAGMLTQSRCADMSTAMWDEMLRVDLRSVFLCARRAVPHMQAQRWGRIINIASQLGIKGGVELSHYAAAKAGVIGFTKSLALEVAPDNVLVNAIAPGPIATPLVDGISADWKRAKEASLPLGRFGRADEVAPTAVLLASDPGGNLYVGQTLGPNSGDVMP